jgi:hypothetical protein
MMIRTISDYLFMSSLISLIIWGMTSGVTSKFTNAILNGKYLNENQGAQQKLFEDKPELRFKKLFTSIFFLFGILGIIISILISYL